ncbi:hypothetical protein ACH4OW_25485 [Streptomyces sp. NPDC017056]|uniref:hypothetical protein n=1 Tax=Streptomyces sp. NPDC017056 TaxID=3364973 RepID=UPI00379B23B5
MASYQQRKATGDAHEKHVARELTLRGWGVSFWEQGTLTAHVRRALRATDTSIRWMPDLIAVRGEGLALVDCKSRMTSGTTHRHAVERAAVHAHLQLTAWTCLPVFYVFDDHGPRAARGSGAAYYLTALRSLCRSMPSLAYANTVTS